MTPALRAAVAAALVAAAAAQDPAGGWLGYAVTSCPAGTTLTFMDGYWPVGATPKRSNSFYSPWFGIDASDNLNLLQPVNPWLGTEWQAYLEYYQWRPEHNQNSAAQVVKANDLLYGSVNKTGASYDLYHNVSGSVSWDVTMNIPIQAGKTYTIAYVVYEKVAPCGDYPPDGSVTFSKLRIFCDNKQITPVWKTAFVEDVCNNRAIVVDPATIKLSWDTSAADPAPEKIRASQRIRSLGHRATATGGLRG